VATGRHTGREIECRDDPVHGSGCDDPDRVLDRSRGHDTAAEPASVGVGPTQKASATSPTNGALGELLRRAARDETDHRRRALERASRASRFWPEEAGAVAGSGRSLTELRAVGPWVAARIEAWLEDPPATEPDETRHGFLTYAEVRRTLDTDPAWESTPCADLQMHTTWSDGTLPLEDMVATSRSLGRTFVAVTDHSQALAIANGMNPAELAEQARAIDALNRGFEEDGDEFRVLRSMEVDLFPDGTFDMDADSLASLDLVLGAFHSELRSKDDQTERYLVALNQPRLHVLAHPKARMYGRRVGLLADWRRVFAEAARLGKALELDATVWRQDLNVELATLAREEGVEWFTIGSDAHAAQELELLPFGMAIAALAGIPRERILNYQPLEFVRRWAHRSQG
jgi:putative hydrolase